MYAPGRYLIIKPASWTRMNDSIMTILEVDSNEDIIKYFYNERLPLYENRKQYMIKELKEEIQTKENKLKFIKETI